MTLSDFFNQWNGKYADFDGMYPGQCKDLFSFFNRDVVGNPDYIRGDAWQLYEACPSKYYKKVSKPQKGDVAIWKKELGGYGHVAIVWDDGRFFSQNYPLKAPCSLQTIPTTKLLGYLRPIMQMTKQQVIDLFRLAIHKDPNETDLAIWVGGNWYDCMKDLLQKEIWMKQNHYISETRKLEGKI